MPHQKAANVLKQRLHTRWNDITENERKELVTALLVQGMTMNGDESSENIAEVATCLCNHIIGNILRLNII